MSNGCLFEQPDLPGGQLIDRAYDVHSLFFNRLRDYRIRLS
jgi:hypothetical protein